MNNVELDINEGPFSNDNMPTHYEEHGNYIDVRELGGFTIPKHVQEFVGGRHNLTKLTALIVDAPDGTSRIVHHLGFTTREGDVFWAKKPNVFSEDENGCMMLAHCDADDDFVPPLLRKHLGKNGRIWFVACLKLYLDDDGELQYWLENAKFQVFGKKASRYLSGGALSIVVDGKLVQIKEKEAA